ncbi:uncharacterized protein A4U43_C01F31420 [Asparagus officinalis]|uniref:DUF7054 domain-containing protein n=1 Tax=Asparagus officinalis TaxID=4686 RepID=A0A5P1FUI7_ASPOF|nr:uncharacterized protein A4U43_C01F31420 [Asparagus officinalis]
MSLPSAPLSKRQHPNKVNKKQNKHTRSATTKCSSNRILISVRVKGSSGHIRLFVNEEESVEAVIRSVLKVYAREGRFPVFGHESGQFYLYCATFDEALKPSQTIGSTDSRNFLMYKKEPQDQKKDDSSRRKRSLKIWLIKFLNFTISSH